ncbi:hypothetical protein FRC07_013227 [Ceratobasidium sp. 392]|nr:hypothetical protein FRC07_013227 [Ceratobasidium sp. 392]
MEVADSHMLEHSSILTPASHADIDMSGDYYEEEYMMHDAHPTTDLVDDEEIYDAEIEEQTGHTEVEMDDYADELIDENETNMGTYMPADDATVTDVTVEDAHLPSSPVVSGTPRGLSPQPATAQSISPHVTAGADLVINEAPANPLSSHSPHSATTLVGDTEIIPPEGENEKLDHDLHEVIDLTRINGENPPIDSNVDPATHEGALNDSELAREELYEEEEDPTTITNPPVLQLPAVDQPQQEEEGPTDSLVANDAYDSFATALHDSGPVEQHDEQAGGEGHSPIEEALVLNQQARDDAADTMEPSPPVRLAYDNKTKNIVQLFDIFAPVDLSPESTDVLFGDNRTLFYDPLSVFFARLREIEYFSDDNWQDAEMELSVDLGDHQLSITEDHKQTDEVSIFKLHFIWSGLGLEGPLQLKLQRHPDRFSIRYAQLLDRLEQRYVHGDEIEGLHEVVRQELQADAVDNVLDHDKEGVDAVELVDVHPAPSEAYDVYDAHDPESVSEPHGNHAVDEDARPGVDVIEHGGEAIVQRNGNEGEHGDELPHNSKLEDENQSVSQVVIDASAEVDTLQAPTSPIGETGQDDPTGGSAVDGDLYADDEYADEYTEADNASTNVSEQRGELVPLPDKDYDEYEEVEEANDLAYQPRGVDSAAIDGSSGQDDEPENYYDEYDDADREANNQTPTTESLQQASTDPQGVNPSLETTLPPSPSRQPLKRNLDDLENDGQEIVSSTGPRIMLSTSFSACSDFLAHPAGGYICAYLPLPPPHQPPPPPAPLLPGTSLGAGSYLASSALNANRSTACASDKLREQIIREQSDENHSPAPDDSTTDSDDSYSDNGSDLDSLLRPLEPDESLVDHSGPTVDDVAIARGRPAPAVAAGAPPIVEARGAAEPQARHRTHVSYSVVSAGGTRPGHHAPNFFPGGPLGELPEAPNAP